jgi:hypothetical protein
LNVSVIAATRDAGSFARHESAVLETVLPSVAQDERKTENAMAAR